jgi:hypothetical protein
MTSRSLKILVCLLACPAVAHRGACAQDQQIHLELAPLPADEPAEDAEAPAVAPVADAVAPAVVAGDVVILEGAPMAAAVEAPVAINPADAQPAPAAQAAPAVAAPPRRVVAPMRIRVRGGQVLVAAPPDNDAQLAAIRNQFQPLLASELSFANRVCQWTAEERVAAIAAAQEWLTSFAAEYAKNNGARNRGFMIMAGNMVMPQGENNLDAEGKLAEALQEKMTDEHRAAYVAERAERVAFRRDATIENIVSQMDQRLGLTADQRRSISKSLRDKWSDDWSPPLELFVQMSEYAPAFPDELVMQFLNPAQTQQWQRVQRISARGVNFGGGMLGGNVQPINDVDLNEGQ